MNKFVKYNLFAAAAISSAAVFGETTSEAVDVFIGTAGLGHVTPAAAYPFGMVQAGPDTSGFPDVYHGDWPHTCGYQHTETNLFRFSQLHLIGTGVVSLGNLGLLPFTDAPTGSVYSAAIDKSTERGAPGWYAVKAGGVDCEIAALAHSAAYRFRYPAGKMMRLLVDSDWSAAGHADGDDKPIGGSWVRLSEMEFPAPDECTGRIQVRSWVTYDLYWTMKFSRPIRANRRILAGGDGRGEIRSLEFGGADRTLEVRLALSVTSREAARKNLTVEMPRFGFDAVRRQSAEAWRKALGVVEVEADAETAAGFRSALYRTMLQPNNLADVGDKPFYSTLSLWDTYRAAHPLYTLICSDRVDDFVSSMLRQYRRQGFLPIWALMGRDTHCMIGHHAVPVIADAYLKGFRGFDAEEAFAAVKNSLTVNHRPDSNSTWGLVKENWDEYDRCGYVPMDGMGLTPEGKPITGESVSRTLECAYDDACAARFAKALGKSEDEKFFARRAGFWKNLLDPETGFMRGRRRDGSWRSPFSPYTIGHCWWQDNDFTEGNSWQWTFHVMQDPEGLVAALGGKAAFTRRLDALFTADTRKECAEGSSGMDVSGLIGQYAHGNEPGHHTAYFHRWSERPWRTDELVREICRSQYAARPEGLCGNDDCGQMAAWYVFSALGFYPFDPCGGEYVLGAPQVAKAVLKVRAPDGGVKTFTVLAKNLSEANKYVKSVTLNGKPITDWKIRHADLVAGGELVFEMGGGTQARNDQTGE